MLGRRRGAREGNEYVFFYNYPPMGNPMGEIIFVSQQKPYHGALLLFFAPQFYHSPNAKVKPKND